MQIPTIQLDHISDEPPEHLFAYDSDPECDATGDIASNFGTLDCKDGTIKTVNPVDVSVVNFQTTSSTDVAPLESHDVTLPHSSQHPIFVLEQVLGDHNYTKSATEQFSDKGPSVKLFNCKQCSKDFSTYRSLQRHNSEQHGDKNYYFCTLCDFRTMREEGLTRHNFSLKHTDNVAKQNAN